MATQALISGCIDSKVKMVLLDTIQLQCEAMSPEDAAEKKMCYELPPLLEALPECPVVSGIMGMIPAENVKKVGYDDDETPVGKKGKKGKKKRKLSDYNRHISVCMKEDKSRSFSDCVALWKKGDKMHERYVEAQEAEEA
jgi:hypothetical protein